MPRLVEFLEGLKGTWIARLQSQFLACLRVDTIIQRNLQYLWGVQIASQQIGLFSERTYLDTSGTAAFACIFQSLSFAYQFLDIGVRIEDAGVTVSLTNHLDTFQ